MLSFDFFNEEINKITRDFTQKKILLTVSGGADSMVMLDLFRKRSAEQSDFIISAAHINYKLRGKDSDLDQKLVEDYCKKTRNFRCLFIPFQKKTTSPKTALYSSGRES